MEDEKGLVSMGMDKQIMVTGDQLALVKRTIFPGCTDDELKLFVYTCTRKGVHPLDKMIHPVKRGQGSDAKVTFQSGIDFMRSEAESTGEYNGQDEAEFEFDDPATPEWPTSAKVKIYRKGIDRPFIGVARWVEFYPGEKMGFQWRKMPTVMLAKCAEAQALRKAFPKKLADLFAPEEMAQADSSQTAAGNKKETRSASVQPAAKPPAQSTLQNQAEDATVVDGSDIPLSEQIDLALEFLSGGEEGPKKNLLMEASRGGKSTGAFLVYAKLHAPETSQPWLVKIMEYLQGKIQEQQQGNE